MPICKPVFIEGTTLGDVWFQLLQANYDHGRRYKITNGSYAGCDRLAFDDISGFIHYPHERPLAPIMPEGSNLPAPTTDHDIEMYFADYLINSNIQDNEDYKYATFIVGGRYIVPNGIWCSVNHPFYDKMESRDRITVPNQVQWVIDHFKKVGFGNEHCYITIGYPESNFAYDIPFTNEQERKTSPCLRGLDFRIITEEYRKGKQCPNCNNKIEAILEPLKLRTWHKICDRCNVLMEDIIEDIPYLLTKVIYRSWDLWGGWPTNMGGFTLLNEYIANELGIEPGPLSVTCKSLHCYDF